MSLWEFNGGKNMEQTLHYSGSEHQVATKVDENIRKIPTPQLIFMYKMVKSQK